VTYTQITSVERHAIAALKQAGHSIPRIAEILGRHRTTIWRELAKNRRFDGCYSPDRADQRVRTRRSVSRRNEQFTAVDKEFVRCLLEQKWSPEQIAGTLREAGLLRISHETIYRWVWGDKHAGGTLHTHLRQSPKRRRKGYGAYDSRGRLAGKRHISERPYEAEERLEPGHWEADTVMGKGSKSCILTMVDRVTGYTLIGKLASRTKADFNRRMRELLRRTELPVKTITADNGTEFHGYEELEREFPIEFYFATPYHSWERGTNENTNGLIRQYLPKRLNMRTLSQATCDWIAGELNSRPRKRLGWKAPEACYAM
jgi:IS30 family transposase